MEKGWKLIYKVPMFLLFAGLVAFIIESLFFPGNLIAFSVIGFWVLVICPLSVVVVKLARFTANSARFIRTSERAGDYLISASKLFFILGILAIPLVVYIQNYDYLVWYLLLWDFIQSPWLSLGILAGFWVCGIILYLSGLKIKKSRGLAVSSEERYKTAWILTFSALILGVLKVR